MPSELLALIGSGKPIFITAEANTDLKVVGSLVGVIFSSEASNVLANALYI
jgi:hypothetical protein